MILEALALSLLDVLAGLLVVALLVLVIAVVPRSERAATEVEPEPEVVEAFSQFPDPKVWRSKGEPTAREDWRSAA